MLQIQDPGNAGFRQVTPQDRDLISEFICGLTPKSQYLRFFAAVAPPSRGLLAALCGGDERSDIFLAVDQHGAIIGHGMTADRVAADGTPVSHLGLVIADSWQLHGIGTALMHLLICRARSRGVEALVMDVLPANQRMLGMIERRWPRAKREHTADSVLITARIDADEPPSRASQPRLAHAGQRPAQRAKEPVHAA